MDLAGVIAHHGYALTCLVLFFASLGLPLPVAITLLAAGSACRHDLRLDLLFLIAWSAALGGDVLLFLGGRLSGWWLLSGLCRLSINPEQCIFTSADAFYRRGARTLLIAKFIPGLGTMAAPLAGSLHMRPNKFIRLMAAGEALYCSTWIAVGYIFYQFVNLIARWLDRVGHAALLLLLAAMALYCLAVLLFTLRSRRYRLIAKITAEKLRQRLGALSQNQLVVIADVRSHNYYDPGMLRIKNSIRIEPSRLHEELLALREFMAPECEIYLYCSCIRDTTSVRISHALQQANLHTTVIEGGMKAWVKAGGEVEPVPEGEVRHLPRFD